MGDKDKLKQAVASLAPAIRIILNVYHITTPICNATKEILNHLAASDDWMSEIAYVSTFLSCLQCCYLFDSIKLSNSSIANTLFFYRRCSSATAATDLPMSEEESSAITSFLGEHQPLHHLLLSTLKNFNEGNGIMASILRSICHSVVLQMDHIEYVFLLSSFPALLRKMSPRIIYIV